MVKPVPIEISDFTFNEILEHLTKEVLERAKKLAALKTAATDLLD